MKMLNKINSRDVSRACQEPMELSGGPYKQSKNVVGVDKGSTRVSLSFFDEHGKLNKS